MQKESVLVIVGILIVSVILLFAVDYFGVPTGKATEFQGPGPAAPPSPPPASSIFCLAPVLIKNKTF